MDAFLGFVDIVLVLDHTQEVPKLLMAHQIQFLEFWAVQNNIMCSWKFN